jgi:hypothetical protein
MALIDKASLLMVPSTYEAGKLYNVLPSGNRAPDNKGGAGYDQTRADFDFDRGSNTAATRIGSDGLLKKYRENLLVNSNQFDITWVNANSSETSGQADKDGGTNAWKIDLTGVSGRIYQSKSQSGVVTFSVYAKKGTLDWVILSSNIVDASFNLATGEKGTLVAGITSSIEDIGGGWYRCSCTGSGAFTQFRIYPAIADNTFTATSGNIYIQDAQAETSLVATEYLDSTSVTGKAGVLVDLPRINYDANGENGSLLLEPSRQQLFQYSEYYEASDWSKSSLSIDTNKDTSPEGVKNASKIYPSASGSISYLYSVKSGVASTYTLSAYVKAAGKNVAWLYVNSGGANGVIYFDLNDQSKQVVAGSAQTPTGNIEPLGNDWYKITFTTGAGIILNSGSGIGVSDAKGSTSVTKNGEDGVLVYGLQLEAGSYATSLIPNHGESGGVTRAADSCLGAGDSSLFNVNGGVLFGEFSAFYDDGTFRQMGISGSTGNEVNLSFDSTSNRIGGIVRSGGTYYVLSHVVSDTTINTKVALKYKVNDLALYVDGVEVDSLSSAAMPTSLNEFNFAIGTTNSNVFYGNVKQVAVFNEALSDSELATLTTL